MELAEEFFINGGELLVVDEIHKYKAGTSDWSKEVKEIYELFPKLKMIVSGSSLLKLKEGDADLSRRAIVYYARPLIHIASFGTPSNMYRSSQSATSCL